MAVLLHTSPPFVHSSFFGNDLEGVPLEVVGVELDEEEFRVIHSMDLRDRNRVYYEEALVWEK